MTSRWLRLLAALLALAVFAAACGNDDDDVTAGGGDTPTPDATPEYDGVVPIGNTGQTSGAILTTDCDDGRPTGGTLTMGMFGEITGWDVTDIQGGAPFGATQMNALYDSLFYNDLTTGELVPGLAESLTTEDYQTFTLKLREGINFTDGTPLDADAFIWNIEHHQTVEGSQSAQDANQIQTMTKVDDLTVELTIGTPSNVFAIAFANRLARMMSPTAYQANQDPDTGRNSELNVRPVGAGAGPFMFESWIQDDEAVLVRNPDYFREGCPYLDRVVFKPITQPDQRYNAFKAGDVDIAYDREQPNILDARGLGYNLVTRSDQHGGYWMLNNENEPFNVRACRLAVAYAVDYDTYNDVIWDGLNRMPRSIFTEDSAWYDPEAVLPGYDPDAAAAALEDCEAALGGPLEFETLCTDSDVNQLQTETLIAMWDAVGITVTANCSEQGAMVNSVFAGEATANPWSIPVQDPDYLYNVYFGDSPEDGVCSDDPEIRSRNWSKSCFPEFDEGLTKGREGLSFEERYAGYSQFQRKFAEEVPVIILNKPEVGYYYSDEVSGVFTTETGSLLLQFAAKG